MTATTIMIASGGMMGVGGGTMYLGCQRKELVHQGRAGGSVRRSAFHLSLVVRLIEFIVAEDIASIDEWFVTWSFKDDEELVEEVLLKDGPSI